ncbi:MAG: YicC/YloC family endoribonuclease [Candidatus Sumerlaeaceae bacterium]
MIRSMTGFGAGHATTDLGEISVEIKSLNNRFLDVNVKFPRELASAELQLREAVKQRVRRGKVDLYVKWAAAPGAQALYEINKPLMQHYARQLEEALHSLGGNETRLDIGALLALPGVVGPTAAAAEDGVLLKTALVALTDALDALEQSRVREGGQLVDAICGHLDVLERLRAEISAAKDELLEEYRKRLRERMEHLTKAVDVALDPARLETELLFYADKSDITEELVRLEAHLKTFRTTLEDSRTAEAVGKPLDFLVQELLREANTIGNKARGVAVAQLVVKMKSEIEKIREQVQNLE